MSEMFLVSHSTMGPLRAQEDRSNSLLSLKFLCELTVYLFSTYNVKFRVSGIYLL
jgi:hypothetical protein